MSRLDSMLRRLSAQRDGLNWVAGQIAGLEGEVLEMGLGNGRTYDHLRELLPERRIWVVERKVNCHPSCVPPAADLLEGECDAALARLAAQGVRLALAHYDFGIGVDAQDHAESARLSPGIKALMVPGGLIVSGQPLVGIEEIGGPEGIPEGRYMFYRA